MKQGHIFELDGEILKECPAKSVTPLSVMYVRWYQQYKNNALLFPGNAGQQPAKLIEAFEIVEDEIAKIEAQKRHGK